MTEMRFVLYPNPVCDFCSDQCPMWSYPTKTFELPERKAESQHDWLACDECASLINAGNWDGLAARSMQTPVVAMCLRQGGSRAYLLTQAKHMHQQFAANRTGDPVRYRKAS